MWLTMGSMQTVMKLMLAISATGRMPVMAEPNAEARMAVSAMGPSSIRSAPNSAASPLRARSSCLTVTSSAIT